MKAFKIETGVVMALDRSNVDTDQIIAKQYLKSIKRSGFGPHLFDNWRYLDPGAPHIDNDTRRLNHEFELNHPRYEGASILLARENFGCGSSREHAVWALDDHGFRAVIAPSFGDIFYNNCFKTGVLPIRLPEAVVDALFVEVLDNEGHALVVDLHQQHVKTPGGDVHEFEIDEFRKECLLNGHDEIELTLRHAADIRAYEERWRAQHPWLFQQP